MIHSYNKDLGLEEVFDKDTGRFAYFRSVRSALDYIHLMQRMKDEALLKVSKTTWGIRCRRESLWIGVHYSEYNRRACINLIPCVTIWIAFAGGKRP